MIRILIASYFMGAATGLVPFQAGRDLASLILPQPAAGIALTAFLFTTSYLILVGRQIRFAALSLAVFLFGAGYMASFGPGATLGLEAFWQDIAIVGGLFLTYSTQPAPVATRRTTRRLRSGQKITPRRITPRNIAATQACKKDKRITPTHPMPTAMMAATTRDRANQSAFAQKPEEMANLFSEVF